MLSPEERVIVALDTPDAPTALALAERLGEARFFKVGLELFVATGPEPVRALRARGARLFLDLKFHDIPNTVAGACRSVAALGVDFVTVHAAGGAAMIRAAVEGVRATTLPPPRVLAVTLLTSLDGAALKDELHVGLPVEAYVRTLALAAREAGADGVVASPREAALLRQTLGPEAIIVTPGIRPGGSATGDQARTLTPGEAIRAGADYLVLGRPITAAPDPTAAWRSIVAEVAACAD